ncbi:Flp family type IVb pilin [Roseibium album]|uniref:Flp pilus assembly protein, pilin Flp n=1 Tax=Roseibium album TaxID=311410 RepID=A0A0M7A7F1_9HYPH|nr:Flp family type IVb pilin [Roseibium album]CTQ58093.1 Flp pilus assembly protein, pilin Flp [Roseibium album]CTQ65535.1 Flp pilus assembly protein, pilin Flp [Roseibium album]CTQ70382.1 Flp pilus assembly protein, pilin Flp [Roseibium album]
MRKNSVKKLATRFLADESGATSIEYGMIVALLGTIFILGLGPIGTTMRDDVFGTIATTLNNSTKTTP